MDSSLLNLLERTRSIGTWRVDVSQSLCRWSPATYAIHEEDPSKTIILDDALRYYIPEHRPIIERCVQEGIEEKKPWDVELQLLTARGNRKWVRAIGEPVFEKDNLVGLHGIFEEIDERKSLEIERETLLQRMLEGERIGKLGHWHWDIENDLRQWTPGVHRIFGSVEASPPLCVEQHLSIVHPNDREMLQAAMKAVPNSDRSFETSYRVLVDGREKYVQTEGFPNHDADGKLIAFSGVTIDRTTEFESRRKIEELNRRLVLALGASGIGVWEWDIRTNALIWDAQMYLLYGIQENEFSGAYEVWQNGLHPEDRQTAEDQIQQAVAKNEKFDAIFRVVWPDETVRTIQGVADVVLDSHGEPERMIGVNWDISEVVANRRELERSNHELAQFAYRTSHDLKGPLTSIRRVAAYMILDIDEGHLDEAKSNALKIENRAAAMETMVLSILDAAKAELTEISPELIDLEAIVRDIIDGSQSLREENDVTVRSSIDCAMPPNLPYIRVYQILYNLASNGIKYASSEREERIVNIRATDRSDHLELSVEDNGLGIPNTSDATPYEMFRRFHTSISGSGLGLYIVKKHVESLDGDISFVTSGAGTRFDVKIPYRRKQ